MYNRSVNKLKYLSVAVNALKRIKNQNTVSAKGEIFLNFHFNKINYAIKFCLNNVYQPGAGDNECNIERLRGAIPLNLKKCNGTGKACWFPSPKIN